MPQIIYPYIKKPSGLFPLIKVILSVGEKKVPIEALIDSGASISVFEGRVAGLLGIKIRQGKEIYLGGVGGRILGYIHHIKLEAAGKKFICPIVFSDEYKVSFNLLGRQGFFNKFKICFNEKNKMMSLE